MFSQLKILPLDADESSRFLPWTIAFMTYLAALALAGAMGLAVVMARFDSGQTSNMTVEVPPVVSVAEAGDGDAGAAPKDAGSRDRARIAAALDLLRATPGVIAAEPLDRQEVVKLLEPWLGKTAASSDLPLPTIIDVTVDRAAEIDTGDLGQRLAAAVPGATIDDHGMWFARLTTFVHSVQLVAGLVVALTCLVAVLTVVYVTLSGLAVHHDIIEMLHLIGAEDGFIARQFQGHALKLGLAGAVPGLLLAVLTVELLALAAGRVDSFLLPNIRLAPEQWVALALVPVAAGIIAMLTARVTVMRRLSRMI
jgi:cell division transport system permease protein